MLWLIDLEHPRLASEAPEAWQLSAARRLRLKYRIEELSGDACHIVHYRRANPEVLYQLPTRGLILTGTLTAWSHYAVSELEGLRAILRPAVIPLLAFGSGFQLLAELHGAHLAARPDTAELESAPAWARTEQSEDGYAPIRVLEPEPLFTGLAEAPIVRHGRACRLTMLPEGFVTLAQSEDGLRQAIGDHDRRQYATQFHPEDGNPSHPEGTRVLENFLTEVVGYRRATDPASRGKAERSYPQRAPKAAPPQPAEWSGL